MPKGDFMKRQRSVLVEIYTKENAQFCSLSCPYFLLPSDGASYCTLSGERIRLTTTRDKQDIRSMFCRKHEQPDRRPSAQFVKSFITN